MKKKWISPQKRLKKYKDFGVKSSADSLEKVKWTKYAIIVPTESDKKEVQAAMEYFHDHPDMDTELVTVNQLVHEYEHGDESDKFSRIIVDYDLFRQINRKLCPHLETHVEDGIKYCKDCKKDLEVTSYRG